MQSRLARADVPVESTWNLDDLFASPAQWEAELAALEPRAPTSNPAGGRLGDSAATLRACLDTPKALQARFMRLSTFAYLRNAQDGTNRDCQAATARAGALGAPPGREPAVHRRRDAGAARRHARALPARGRGLAAHRVPLQRLLETRPHRLGAEVEGVLARSARCWARPTWSTARSKSGDIQVAPFTDAQGVAASQLVQPLREAPTGPCGLSGATGAWASFSAGLKAYNNTYAATHRHRGRRRTWCSAACASTRSTEDVRCCSRTRCRTELYTDMLRIIRTELAPHMQRYAEPAPPRAGPRPACCLAT